MSLTLSLLGYLAFAKSIHEHGTFVHPWWRTLTPRSQQVGKRMPKDIKDKELNSGYRMS